MCLEYIFELMVVWELGVEKSCKKHKNVIKIDVEIGTWSRKCKKGSKNALEMVQKLLFNVKKVLKMWNAVIADGEMHS